MDKGAFLFLGGKVKDQDFNSEVLKVVSAIVNEILSFT